MIWDFDEELVIPQVKHGQRKRHDDRCSESERRTEVIFRITEDAWIRGTFHDSCWDFSSRELLCWTWLLVRLSSREIIMCPAMRDLVSRLRDYDLSLGAALPAQVSNPGEEVEQDSFAGCLLVFLVLLKLRCRRVKVLQEVLKTRWESSSLFCSLSLSLSRLKRSLPSYSWESFFSRSPSFSVPVSPVFFSSHVWEAVYLLL